MHYKRPVLLVGGVLLGTALTLAVASAETVSPGARASSGSGDGHALAATARQLVQQEILSFIPSLGEDAPEWLKRVEINGTFLDTSKPERSILTVQPLYQSEQNQDTLFVQGSIYHYALFGDYRWTGNIGAGYRRLLADNTVLLGVNAFFDNEFTYGHQRMSIGTEAKWGPLDFGFNNYLALSGDKTVNNSNIERALGGQDVHLSTQLPYVPWTRVGGSYFRWEAIKAVNDITGATFTADFALHPNLGFQYRWSSRDLNNNNSQAQNAFLVQFRLAGLNSPTLATGPVVSEKIFETRDLSNETLKKVVRENRIIVEQRTTGGVVISRGN